MVDWRGESTLASHVSLVQKNYPQTLFHEKHCSSYRPWQRINHASFNDEEVKHATKFWKT